MAIIQPRLNRGCIVRIAVSCGQSFDCERSKTNQVICAQAADVWVVMSGDGRTASPSIGNGQAVLRHDSATERERCARPIRRVWTCTLCGDSKRPREGDWQLRRTFSARRLHPATTTQP